VRESGAPRKHQAQPKKRTEKTDGIVALTMGVARWMAKAPEAEIDLEWI
jgi:hypothetical protein